MCMVSTLNPQLATTVAPRFPSTTRRTRNCAAPSTIRARPGLVFSLRRSKFQRVLLGALSATTALLAACSSSQGPLGNGGTQGQQCFPGRQGQPVTLGLY